MFSTAASARRWIDARVKNGELRKNMPAGRGRCARPAELVKKVFLTSSQTRPTALGSRLKRLRLAAAHSLTFARLRAVKYFLRRTRRRRKYFRLYLRLRAQTLRGFFMEKSPFRRGEAAAEGISFDEALPLPEASLGGESFISNASPYRRARRPSGGRGSRPYRCSPSFHKSQAPPWWG